MKLNSNFYNRSAIIVAQELLGKAIVCNNNKFMITETECYVGEQDTACHARFGKTARNSVMYENGGLLYVYLCYGIHNLLNIVTGSKHFPEAVLIRGVKGFPGPGRVTKAIGIDRSWNRESLLSSPRIWLKDEGTAPEYDSMPRIGIDYATPEYRDKLWRFVMK